jgi:hypothetical protein
MYPWREYPSLRDLILYSITVLALHENRTESSFYICVLIVACKLVRTRKDMVVGCHRMPEWYVLSLLPWPHQPAISLSNSIVHRLNSRIGCTPISNQRIQGLLVDSKAFWQWCITFRIGVSFLICSSPETGTFHSQALFSPLERANLSHCSYCLRSRFVNGR